MPEKIEFTRCYMCNAPMEKWGTKWDWGRKLNLLRCPDCGSISTEYVEYDYYQTHYGHEYWFGCVKTLEERKEHDYGIAKLRMPKIMKLCPPPAKLLDVGCSNGAFLKLAKEMGYDAYGVELDDAVIAFAKEFSGCPVSKGPVTPQSHLPICSVIALHDVVEHFVDPRMELRDISGFLAPEGLMVIDTPDFDCDLFEERGIDYHHIRPYEHMHCLKHKHYVEIFRRLDLTIIDEDYPIPGKVVYYLTS